MPFELSAAIAVLERTPETFRALLSGRSAEWTETNEGGESWSPFVIMGQLVHGERTGWISRAELILSQGPDRRFTPYDRFTQFEDSRGKSMAMLLDEFAQLHCEYCR